MPYSKSQGGGSCNTDEWAVLGPEGKTMGCHATEDDADRQLAALYANEPEARSAVPNTRRSQTHRWRIRAHGSRTNIRR